MPHLCPHPNPPPPPPPLHKNIDTCIITDTSHTADTRVTTICFVCTERYPRTKKKIVSIASLGNSFIVGFFTSVDFIAGEMSNQDLGTWRFAVSQSECGCELLVITSVVRLLSADIFIKINHRIYKIILCLNDFFLEPQGDGPSVLWGEPLEWSSETVAV